MAERPDHDLVLSVSNRLREFGEAQLQMIAALQRLRADFGTPLTVSGSPSVRPAIGGQPQAEVSVRVTQEQAPVPPAPVPMTELTVNSKHDYDYFDELDARLARIDDEDTSNT